MFPMAFHMDFQKTKTFAYLLHKKFKLVEGGENMLHLRHPVWDLTKNNPYTHNRAQALLLQRQSPDKGMPHKNPAKESDTVSVFALHSQNCAYSRHTHTLCPFMHMW